MDKIKIVTIVGTRPELIKLSRVIARLDEVADHKLAHTGQNFDHELSNIFLDELGIRQPDTFLQAAGANAAETIANVIRAADAYLAEEKPEAVLLLGDTNSCLSVIPAKRRKIPVFHMEAGNRCFDERVPEEINRRIVDHLSDINLPYTEHARRYLIAEGLRPETIIKTGSPMREVIEHYRAGVQRSEILTRLGLAKGKYFVVSAHREENVDSDEMRSSLIDALNGVAEKYGMPIIFSTHPRTRNRLAQASVAPAPDGLIQFHKPFGLFDYLQLQTSSFCVLSDSGTLTEEAAILGFPAVMLREAHERPEGMDEAVTIMSGLDRRSILRAIEAVRPQDAMANEGQPLVPDYQSTNVSDKVARIILSYTGYVNRTVWRKYSD